MAKPFSRIRGAATDGRCLNPIFRKTQLQRLHGILSENASDVQASMAKDTSHTRVEVAMEYWLSMRLLAETHDSLDPEAERKEEYAVANNADVPNGREAVGVVLIRPAPTRHAFLFGLMSALVPALASGNCVVVQIENTLLQTPKLILELIATTLDCDIFYVTSAEVGDSDLGDRHVSVLQTGSVTTSSSITHRLIVSDPDARVVAIVERDADLETAAKSLVAARFALGGRSPYAPDVVLVNEWVKKDFLAAVLQQVVSQSAAVEQVETSKHGLGSATLDAGRGPFSERARLETNVDVLSSGASGDVVCLEDRSSLFGEKISERCLVVHAVTSMDDAIDTTSRLSRLGAAYVFAAPPAAKYITQFIDSPTSFVNHVPLEILFNPMARRANPLTRRSSTLTTYTENMFTFPKSIYVNPSKSSQPVEEVLTGSAPYHVSFFSAPPISVLKRIENRADIGFFNQGIVTGAVMLLSVVVMVGGSACHFGLNYFKPLVF